MTSIAEAVFGYWARLDECGPRPVHMSRDEWFERRAHEMRCFPTPAEQYMAELLAARKTWHFRQQHRLGNYIVDFCDVDARVVIELDGSSHDGREEPDRVRQRAIEEMGYQIVRCTNRRLFEDPNEVLFQIVYARARYGRYA